MYSTYLEIELMAQCLNTYYCSDCSLTWHDVWSCEVDMNCQRCSKIYSPVKSIELTEEPINVTQLKTGEQQ